MITKPSMAANFELVLGLHATGHRLYLPGALINCKVDAVAREVPNEGNHGATVQACTHLAGLS